MTPEQDERLVAAFEGIARHLDRLAAVGESEFRKKYLRRQRPKEATLTRVLTDEDKIRQDQGASEETLDRWLTLGPREQAYEARAAGKK